MYKDVLTRHAAGDRHGDLAFAGAVDEQVVGLCPFGEGFAEEGLSGVGDAGWRRIMASECGVVIRYRSI